MTDNRAIKQILRGLIEGQEQARVRTYGSLEAIPDFIRKKICGTTTRNASPELQSVAPFPGEFFHAGFRIIRRDVDELVNFYVYRQI